MAAGRRTGATNRLALAGRGRDVVEAALAVVAAFAAMALVAALALSQLDAGSWTSLGATTAAVVVLAVGGSIDVGATAATWTPITFGAQGSLDIVPLGISLVGAATLVLAFLVPLRRRAPLDLSQLSARVGAGGATFMTCLVLADRIGNGLLALPKDLSGGGSGGIRDGFTRPDGQGLRPDGRGLGGNTREELGNSLREGWRNDGSAGGGNGLDGGRALADNATTAGFDVSLVPTLLIGMLWFVCVIALGWLAMYRTPLPSSLTLSRLARHVRPAVSAMVAVTLGLVVVATALAVLVGQATKGGAAVAGPLLVMPSVVFVALTVGVGVPWTVTTDGLLDSAASRSSRLAALVDGDGAVLSLGALPGPAVVAGLVGFTAVFMLTCGVVSAWRSSTAGGPCGDSSGHRLRRATVNALRLAPVTALAMAGFVMLARATVSLDFVVFDFALPGALIGLAADVSNALGLGLVGGGLAGAAGSLVWDGIDSARRKRSSTRHGRPVVEVPGYRRRTSVSSSDDVSVD